MISQCIYDPYRFLPRRYQCYALEALCCRRWLMQALEFPARFSSKGTAGLGCHGGSRVECLWLLCYIFISFSQRYIYSTLLSTKDQNEMYADDSKSEIGVGFAALRRLQLAIFLRQPRSSLQLHVIFAVVKMTRDLRNYSIVTYCNSRSALQAIKSLHSSHPVVREAHDWLELVSARQNCWVQRLVSKGRSELTGGPRQLPLSPGMLALLSHTPPWNPASEVGGSNGS